MAVEVGVEDESFQALPSRKLLTDLVQSARDEICVKWDSGDGEDDYPILGRLWAYVRAASRATLRRSPADVTARTLWTRWEEIDRRRGEPRARGWRLNSREADEREEVLVDYLVDSGLLGLTQAEKSAPRHYLAERELEGQ